MWISHKEKQNSTVMIPLTSSRTDQAYQQTLLYFSQTAKFYKSPDDAKNA